MICVTINHEHKTDEEVTQAIDDYELDFGLSATDPLTHPLDRLVDMVLRAFPEIVANRATIVQ